MKKSLYVLVFFGVVIVVGAFMYNSSLHETVVPEPTYSNQGSMFQKSSQQSADQDTAPKPTPYINNQLGLSFQGPGGGIKTRTSDDGKPFPFVSDGIYGKSFYGLVKGTSITLAGATPDFSNDGEYDCGALSSLEKYKNKATLYGERTNKKGIAYVYAHIESESDGSYNVAYFKLKKGVFPVVGFCDQNVENEKQFTEFLDTVETFSK
jgi:hypothetical protein